jgi:hypothetical protein
MIPDRFKQFEETQLFKLFGECFDFDECYDTTNSEYYIGQLTTLRRHIGYDFTLEDDHVLAYLQTDNECIHENHISKFIIFARVIDELYSNYVMNIKKELTKIKKTLPKEDVKLNSKLEKQRIKEEKEQDKIRLRDYNLEVITCECGFKCARLNIRHHLSGRDHASRCEAIQYYKDSHGLK